MEQLTPEEMDANAKEAMQDLMKQNTAGDLSLFDIATWWKEWYLKAGHKRLGRIILKFVPEED